ncbi:MAG TPA: DEAD/DEAH box helicase [Cyclobacteriaceae bacterium]|nr:DEAD/DEAH box helicase [Cyclobacteriaceae bacterium]
MEAANNSWESLKLNPSLYKALAEAGFQHPTEIQRKVVPLVLGGQAVIGVAQTGTGKTAAYLLPLLKKLSHAQGNDPRVLVLVPTKELVVQVVAHAVLLASRTDLRMVGLYGGVGPKTQIEQLQAGVDLIIATPGRFMELYYKEEIIVKQIKTLVLDEADRMLDMGFMQQLKKILEVIPPRRQNLLFSATFSEKVEKLAAEFLEFPVRVDATPLTMAAQQVEQSCYHTPNLKTKINLLDYLLQDREKFSRVLIFSRTKESATDIFKFIDRKGLGPARVIHSNKGQNSRINAMDEFKNGNLRVLVSTDVSARGIDVANVSHVINFDVPQRYEDYVHRIGRTGRAFHTGEAITLLTEAEVFHIRRIEKLIKEKIKVKKLPVEVEIPPTPEAEAKEIAREVDRQKRLEDPTFQGAFHERKRK